VRDDRARELQIFTDLQAGSFVGTAEIDDSWAVRVMRVAPEQERNGRVASLTIGPSHPVPPGATLSVTARIEDGSGNGATNSAEIAGETELEARLLVDGRTAAIRTASWGSDIAFSIPAPDPGAHVVRVEIDPTGLRADDGRQTGIRVAESAAIRIAGGSLPDAEYIVKAIQTLGAEGRVRVSAEPVDVLVQVAGALDRGRSTEGPATARILIPPSDQLALAGFNRELARLGVPWRVEPDPSSGMLGIEGGELPAVDGESVKRRYLLLRGTAPASQVDSVILRTSDGEAWLVRGRTPDSGVYLLIGSALVPEATGLPAGVGMIEFVDAVINLWSRPGDPAASIEAGEEMALPPRADSLAGPDGPPLRVEGGAPWRPRTTGAWRISSRAATGRDIRFVGVNVPPAESVPSTLDSDGLATAIGSASDLRLSPPDRWSDEIFAARRGRDLSAVVLWMVLALLALETWLVGSRRGRAPSAEVHASPGANT
jgi:hypothetical protein